MKYRIFIVLFAGILFLGWGANGHKIINRKITISFPSSMSSFFWMRDSLAFHAPDADTRKSSDPNESMRHYIDIDAYPEFVSTGRIAQTLDSLIALHGSSFVNSNGIVPFAILQYTDSVKIAFQQHNWNRAMLKSADLGHYVADAHQPLHITQFYDGRSTYGSGVHSRYETSMINRDSSFIQYTNDSAAYISNINSFVFNFVYSNFKYVDSVLISDSLAHLAAGSTSSTVYYDSLWKKTGTYTTMLFKNASYRTACLIYTAWINAGSPVQTGISSNEINLNNFDLCQNYPNPFNPVTKIKVNITGEARGGTNKVSLKVYDIQGKEVQTLLNESLTPGVYEVTFNGNNLSSGVYLYKLTVSSQKNNTLLYSNMRKMLLIK